jgi:hypothetical protein
LGFLAALDFATGWLEGATWWKIIGAAAGLLGLYHLLAHLLQRPLIGVMTALDFIARKLFTWRLKRREMTDRFDLNRIEVAKGQIKLRDPK